MYPPSDATLFRCTFTAAFLLRPILAKNRTDSLCLSLKGFRKWRKIFNQRLNDTRALRTNNTQINVICSNISKSCLRLSRLGEGREHNKFKFSSQTVAQGDWPFACEMRVRILPRRRINLLLCIQRNTSNFGLTSFIALVRSWWW